MLILDSNDKVCGRLVPDGSDIMAPLWDIGNLCGTVEDHSRVDIIWRRGFLAEHMTYTGSWSAGKKQIIRNGELLANSRGHVESRATSRRSPLITSRVVTSSISAIGWVHKRLNRPGIITRLAHGKFVELCRALIDPRGVYVTSESTTEAFAITLIGNYKKQDSLLLTKSFKIWSALMPSNDEEDPDGNEFTSEKA